ncbi:hypothetical protein ACIOHC_11280 [Streptomyces sp. NPDC088252]|uniref:hypothetical protein n=1 Tax=unclassified Streptomyces TaxID=2593676 RepID=UPI00380760CD
MTDRIPLDRLTSDQLDALYDQMERTTAHVAELEQALTDADGEYDDLAAHNDRTCEAVAGRDWAEAAIERVRAIHRPVDYRHTRICVECSDYGGSSCDKGMREWPCATTEALDQPQQPTCGCGESTAPRVVHRPDGPCHMDEQPTTELQARLQAAIERVLSPKGIRAAAEAISDQALTHLGRDLGTIHVERIAEAGLRAALDEQQPTA